MSNAINVTVELCQEDRKRLDELISFAGLLVGEQKQYNNFITNLVCAKPAELAPAEEPAGTPAPVEPAAAETGHPVDEVSPHGEPEPAAEPEQPEAPKYTKEDILALVQKLAAPTSPEHKRTGAKAIVKSYGAKVSDIPADKYAEAMDKLTALDKEG